MVMGMAKYADITPFYEWLDWLEKESNTNCPEYETLMFYEIRDKLDTLLEVVRCEDCKFALDVESKKVCIKGINWRAVEPNHFCSYGERRNDER
jgi:hypothetical protein